MLKNGNVHNFDDLNKKLNTLSPQKNNIFIKIKKEENLINQIENRV